MFAVVAGTGYTGRRVLEKLPADASLGLGRTPIDTDRRFEIVDFDAPGALSVTLPDPCTVLYTCPPDGERDDRLQRFLAALPHSPNRIVYISTTGVYGDCAGAVVTEDTPVNADNRLSRPRVAAEELLTLWAEKHACDLVILRVPGIYGPGRLGVARLKSGEAWLEEAESTSTTSPIAVSRPSPKTRRPASTTSATAIIERRPGSPGKSHGRPGCRRRGPSAAKPPPASSRRCDSPSCQRPGGSIRVACGKRSA
ncbi:MAG: NAD-dependent epimerase/dehydratase family protein [Woeseiaceae bacterium]